MYFKVYHKKTRQLVSTYNERAIVDFYLRNKENISSYFFIEGNTDKALDGDDFAYKYAPLFDKKAAEREKERRSEFEKNSDAGEIEDSEKSSGVSIVIWLLILLILLVAGSGVVYVVIASDVTKDETTDHRVRTTETDETDEKIVFPKKRAEQPEDSRLDGTPPSVKELKKAWKNKKKLPKALSFAMIKKQMDTFLPTIKKCYDMRMEKGDKKLRGSIKMKIRVTGDGSVLDVIFTTNKYHATLFGDCIRKEILSASFPMFRGKEQVFSYYFEL